MHGRRWSVGAGRRHDVTRMLSKWLCVAGPVAAGLGGGAWLFWVGPAPGWPEPERVVVPCQFRTGHLGRVTMTRAPGRAHEVGRSGCAVCCAAGRTGAHLGRHVPEYLAVSRGRPCRLLREGPRRQGVRLLVRACSAARRALILTACCPGACLVGWAPRNGAVTAHYAAAPRTRPAQA